MGIANGFAFALISLAALYVAGAVCAWIWAPWWAALALSAPLIWVGLVVAVEVVALEWNCRRRNR